MDKDTLSQLASKMRSRAPLEEESLPRDTPPTPTPVRTVKPTKTIETAKKYEMETNPSTGRRQKKRNTTCPECGQEFIPVNVNQKKCPDCIRLVNEAAKEELKSKLPTKVTPTPTQTIISKYPPRFCDKCGLEYIPVRKESRYCPEHAGKVNRAPETLKPDKSGIIKCLVCGKEKEVDDVTRAKYCSVKCRGKTNTKEFRAKKEATSDNQKMVWVRCDNPECPNDNKFQTTWQKYRSGAKFCDRDCRDTYKRLNSKKYQQEQERKQQEATPEQTVEIPYEPHSGGQEEIHNDYKIRFRVINSGTRWGKDRCSINEFIRLFAAMLSEKRDDSLVPRVHAWIVAPTFPLARQSWRELKYFFPEQWVVNKNESEHQLSTIMDGLIEVKSADNPDSLVSVGLDLVLMTEAARVKDLETTWGYLRGRLSSPGRGLNGQGGSALINSTPKGRSFYYTMYCWGLDPNMPSWKSYHHPTSDNPYINPEEVEEARKTLPENVFRQEFLAEFLSGSGDVFSNIDDVSTGIIQLPETGMLYKAAWDPAMIADWSAFGIRNVRGEQVFLARWTGIKWTMQLDKLERLCKMYNHAPVEIDCTGSGATTFPEAVAQRGIQPIPQVFSNASKEQMVSHMAMLLENKSLTLLDKNINEHTKAQSEELKSYTYTYTKTGKISYGHLPGQHDDCVDMLMLLYRDYDAPVDVLPYMGVLLGGHRQRFGLGY